MGSTVSVAHLLVLSLLHFEVQELHEGVATACFHLINDFNGSVYMVHFSAMVASIGCFLAEPRMHQLLQGFSFLFASDPQTETTFSRNKPLMLPATGSDPRWAPCNSRAATHESDHLAASGMPPLRDGVGTAK